MSAHNFLYSNLIESLSKFDTHINILEKGDNFTRSLQESRLSHLLFEDSDNEMTGNFTSTDAQKLLSAVEQLKGGVNKLSDILILPGNEFANLTQMLKQLKVPEVQKITQLALKADAGNKRAVTKLRSENDKINLELQRIIKLVNAVLNAFSSVKNNISPFLNDKIKSSGGKISLNTIKKQSLNDVFADDKETLRDIVKLVKNKIRQGSLKSKNFFKKIFNMDEKLPIDVNDLAAGILNCKLSDLLNISDKTQEMLAAFEKTESVIRDVDVSQQPQQEMPTDQKPVENSKDAVSDNTQQSTQLKLSDLLSDLKINKKQSTKFINSLKAQPIDQQLTALLAFINQLPSDKKDAAVQSLSKLNFIAESRKRIKAGSDDEFDRWAKLAGIK